MAINEEKKKALDAAIAKLEKDFGKGAVMRLGDSSAHVAVETVPTGCLSLHLALGLGGSRKDVSLPLSDRSPVVRRRFALYDRPRKPPAAWQLAAGQGGVRAGGLLGGQAPQHHRGLHRRVGAACGRRHHQHGAGDADGQQQRDKPLFHLVCSSLVLINHSAGPRWG